MPVVPFSELDNLLKYFDHLKITPNTKEYVAGGKKVKSNLR